MVRGDNVKAWGRLGMAGSQNEKELCSPTHGVEVAVALPEEIQEVQREEDLALLSSLFSNKPAPSVSPPP